MDSSLDIAELDVLSEEELAAVVGGDARNFNAQDFVNNKIGMCGCGLAH